jgi:hypothetical protein
LQRMHRERSQERMLLTHKVLVQLFDFYPFYIPLLVGYVYIIPCIRRGYMR